MKIKVLFYSAAATLFFVIADDVRASGTYRSNSPKPPPREQSGERVDRDRYSLGQRVFNGKAAPAKGDAVAQKPRLAAIQAQLPEKVARKKDLTTLSGQLSEEQLSALGYYVDQRYGKK